MSKTISKAKAAGRQPASGKKLATGKLRSAGKAAKTSALVKTARTAAKPTHRAAAKRPGLKRAAPIRQTKPVGRAQGRKAQRPSPAKAAPKAAKARNLASASKAQKAKKTVNATLRKPPVAIRPKAAKDHRPKPAKPTLVQNRPVLVKPVPVKPVLVKPVPVKAVKPPVTPQPPLKAVAPAPAPTHPVVAHPVVTRPVAARPLASRAEPPRPPQGKRPMPMRPHLVSAPPRPGLHGARPALPAQPGLPPKPPLHAQVVVKQSPAMALKNAGFATGDFVVYPTHGVGRIIAVENQQIAGHDLQLFVINFEKDRMTLRVPVPKAHTSGLRRLSTRKEMQTALTKLKGRSRARRTMWSRRAQEYEAKINSGDPNSIAEVVRDLHRNAGQPDQSYSERQIYQAALDRLAREFAAIEKIDEQTAAQRLEQMLRAA